MFWGAHSARVWAAAARCSGLWLGENAPLDQGRKSASRRAAETGTRAERAPRSSDLAPRLHWEPNFEARVKQLWRSALALKKIHQIFARKILSCP